MTIIPHRSFREWFSSLPILILLASVLFFNTAEMGYSQFLKLGESLWQDYYILRGDITTPSCDPNARIDTLIEKQLKSDLDGSDDEFGDLFGSDDTPQNNNDALRKSLERQQALCQQNHQLAADNQARVNDNVRAFRSIDYFMLKISAFSRDNQRTILTLLLFVCGITSMMTYHHIGLRPMVSSLDHKVGAIAQVIANIALSYSAYTYLDNGYNSGIEMLYPQIRWLYLVGFCVFSIVALYQVISPPKDATNDNSYGKAFLSIPLYCYMTFAATYFYIFKESNPQGIILNIDKMMDMAGIFTKIGLYIWIGMMLKQTFIGELAFRIFKPWKLPPEILAFVAVLVMAVPTAYTGASGVIIIAMGAVVYSELRRAGARRQLALAATAMSGSLGVVLRPCLLVVLIAALNKEVTTDQMFDWGIKVFMLTSFMFFAISLIAKQGSLKIAPISKALLPSLKAFIPLLPYAAIFGITTLFYAIIMDSHLDEFSAATILPVIVLLMLVYEKVFSKTGQNTDDFHDQERESELEPSVRNATTNSIVHIGALLLLMALSLAAGGVIEDSHIIQNFSENADLFGNVWQTMALLLIALVIIGMCMDPFGAVVLVSGTIAQVAYQNGIDPLHFWMITLVAFELGYLSPPVAVNHLLTRQVVGEKEVELAAKEVIGQPFWFRHEKILLPLTVMGVSLLLVAFAPLIYMNMS
ncbi:MAG: TRAP transporter permease [Pseudomonadales bacterium]|nr:TRAP transporter permease [Pseudomonadales bacterium]